MKICTKCTQSKLEEEFRICKYRNGKSYLKSICKICESKLTIEYFEKHPEKRSINNIETIKEWKLKNKDKINKRDRTKLKANVPRRLKKAIYGIIFRALKKFNNKSKICLPYNTKQIKEYFENQFEPWMNWNNYGEFNYKTWDDDNTLTWTWNIKHLKELPYTSIKDENFTKYWALENLKPFSTKQILLNKITKTEKPTHKICRICKKELDICNFEKYKTKVSGIIREYYKSYCKNCNGNKPRIWKDKYIIFIKNYNKTAGENKKIDLNTATYKQIYYLVNKERENKIYREKCKNDISFKLRKRISRYIGIALKKSNSCKNNLSCLKYLEYTIQELKIHIEKQFNNIGNYWMNWNNNGSYNSHTWNDDDKSTWTWQLDHIIPQSDLLYSSMEDDNFKICWALSNLRPLSAKQNSIDGATRIRHIR